MAGLDDITALLDDAEQQIAVAGELHDKALANVADRARFKARIKNVLEHQRSTLDYLAVEITNRYGTPKGLIYYPLAQAPTAFAGEMDGKMPGVAANEPKIAGAIERHQPYQPHHEWLRELNKLTREQKHNQLSAQLVREVYQCRVTEKATGASVQWRALRFVPAGIQFDDGAIELRNTADRGPGAPKPMEVGKGPTGTLVFGVPIDVETQRPFSDPRLDVESGPLHQWCFFEPHKPVLDALGLFQSSVRHAIEDIAHVARL